MDKTPRISEPVFAHSRTCVYASWRASTNNSEKVRPIVEKEITSQIKFHSLKPCTASQTKAETKEICGNKATFHTKAERHDEHLLSYSTRGKARLSTAFVARGKSERKACKNT